MRNIEQFFKLGMKRDVGELKDPTCLNWECNAIKLNIGCGEHEIEGAIGLDYPDYDADADAEAIPYDDKSVAVIHAYHFIEHLEKPIYFLQEAQRVLEVGGIMNICVPYYTSNLYGSDLDHKHVFTENTFKNLFNTKYYNKNRIDWEFKINMSLIIGIEERCLALLVQLEKI